jgi:hypothetical protein
LTFLLLDLISLPFVGSIVMNLEDIIVHTIIAFCNHRPHIQTISHLVEVVAT